MTLPCRTGGASSIRCNSVALARRPPTAYFYSTVLGPLAITIAAGVLLIVAVVVLTTRRVRSQDRFELGSVSPQWLLGHKDEH